MKFSETTKKYIKEALILTSLSSFGAYYVTSDSFLNTAVQATLKLPSVQKKIKFDYDELSGCILCGRYVVKNAKIKNEIMDIQAERLLFQLNLDKIYKTLFKNEPLEFEKIYFDNMKGDVYQPDIEKVKKEKSSLIIKDLFVRDSSINFHTSQQEDVKIDIVSIKTLNPFHSKDLLFNLVFQSNIQANIEGAQIIIKSHPKVLTQWDFYRVPISLFKKLNNHDVLDILCEGNVNIHMSSINMMDEYPIKCYVEFEGLILDHQNEKVRKLLKEAPLKFSFELENTIKEEDLKNNSKDVLIEKFEESMINELNKIVKEQFNEKVIARFQKMKEKFKLK